MGEEEVSDEHRLRRTEMRERRHQRVARRCRLRRQGVDHGGDGALQPRYPAAQIEPQIQRDLFVARTAGVQAAAGVADPFHQLALHETVHVFVVARDERRVRARLVEERRQRPLERVRVTGGQHAGVPQRAPPRDAAGDVVFEQTAIETEGGAELEGRGVGGRVEAAGP